MRGDGKLEVLPFKRQEKPWREAALSKNELLIFQHLKNQCFIF